MKNRFVTIVTIITGRNEVVAKVMFLFVSVILLTGGVCLSACWDTTLPLEQTPSPRSRHPQQQTPPRTDTPHRTDTPRADTPKSRPPGSRPLKADNPLEQTPSKADTPQSRHPPKQTHPQSRHTTPEQTPLGADTPRKADSSIRSLSSRYPSYWNAFLF